MLRLLPLALLLTTCGEPTVFAPRWPPTMVWAWDRSEDLSWVDPATTGVAVLAGRVVVHTDRFETLPRHGRLRLPSSVLRVTTVRVEDDSHVRLTAARVNAVAEAVLGLFARHPSVELQIDFDAVVSERSAYKLLLVRLRERLPLTVQLSITGLASWCLGDPWVRSLSVDVVPQFYRMGADTQRLRATLDEETVPSSSRCQAGVALALDEPAPSHWPTPTLWYFSPVSWTPALAARVGLIE